MSLYPYLSYSGEFVGVNSCLIKCPVHQKKPNTVLPLTHRLTLWKVYRSRHCEGDIQILNCGWGRAFCVPRNFRAKMYSRTKRGDKRVSYRRYRRGWRVDG